jgi:hypothetical protein
MEEPSALVPQECWPPAEIATNAVGETVSGAVVLTVVVEEGGLTRLVVAVVMVSGEEGEGVVAAMEDVPDVGEESQAPRMITATANPTPPAQTVAPVHFFMPIPNPIRGI